ncbi:siderophore-interacting protein [Micropruina sonneratiae]|uniref:siderophore-interacting protein n=1 Tax=Micropruina sonneratiae TaxID=2986940 RepID=UPI00222796CA|nr:siderophore-interacting protein [Micropruina sp. KQZ13P-5]MCW3157360.1 siderophore-interacting protein [Micropruina sp. KQZ13P-5]
MPRTRRQLLTFPINVRALTVSNVVDVTPGLRRITLTGDQLGAFTTADGIAVPALRNEGFDDHVKIIVPDLGESEIRPPRQVEGHLDWSGSSAGKDYTPRRWDPDAGELDLEFVRHGTGPAATWVERVRPGDSAWIAGPKASALLPDDVDWLLIGGDETALPAIGRLIDDLPPDARAQVFVEVADAAHEVPMPGLACHPGVQLTWVHRGAAEPGTSDVLEQAIRAAQWWQGRPYCWVAGEALTLKPIRAHLKYDREVPPDCLEVVGYWRRRPVLVDETTGTETVAPDDTRARLHALLETTAPAAVRAAVTLGVIQRLDAGSATAAALAADLGLQPAATTALLRYLAAIEVLRLDGDDYALAELGLELADDDDLERKLGLGGPGALVELTAPALVEHLRTGAVTGAGDALAALPALAQGLRDLRGDEATWYAPSIVQHWNWAGHAAVTVTGAGAPETAGSLLDVHPGLSVTVSIAPPEQLTSSALLAVQALDQLPDDAAAERLAGLAARAADAGAELVLVERTLYVDELHDHDAELDLKLRVAFGSGVRTVGEWRALFEAAGVRPGAEVDLGWDLRLWPLSGSAQTS